MHPIDINDVLCNVTGFKKGILNLSEHIKLNEIKKNTSLVHLNNELTVYQDSINRDEFIVMISVPKGKVILPFNYVDEIVYLVATDVSVTPAHDYFSNFPDFYESSKVVNNDGRQYSLRELLRDKYLVVVGFKLNVLAGSTSAQTNEDLEMICDVEQDLTLEMKKLTFAPNEQYLFGFSFVYDESGISYEINRRQNDIIDNYVSTKDTLDDADTKTSRGKVMHNIDRDRHDRGGRMINHSDMSNPRSTTSKKKNTGSSYQSEFVDTEKIVGNLSTDDDKIRLKKELLNKKFVCYNETLKCGLLSFNPANNEANVVPQRTCKNSAQYDGSQVFGMVNESTNESELYSPVVVSHADLGVCVSDLYDGTLEIEQNDVATFLHTSNAYTTIFGYQSCLPTLITSHTDNLTTLLTSIGSRSNHKRYDCCFGYVPGDHRKQNFPSKFIEDGKGTRLELSTNELEIKNEITNKAKYIIFSVDL